MDDAQRMAEVFVELADTIVDNCDVVDFLQNLTDRCVELLGADAAGLTLSDQRGGVQLLAATMERAPVLELFELQVQEGPCLDCFHTGRAITNVLLESPGVSGPGSPPPRSQQASGAPMPYRCGCEVRSSGC